MEILQLAVVLLTPRRALGKEIESSKHRRRVNATDAAASAGPDCDGEPNHCSASLFRIRGGGTAEAGRTRHGQTRPCRPPHRRHQARR